METEVITKELTKFNTTDAAIAALRQEYMPLVIKGLDDKEGYDLVHKARMEVKTRRVQVTKRGKELREEAVAFQKAVITEEKRIIGLLEPIEDHLEEEETRVEQERARIKAETEAREVTRIQSRVNALFALGCRFDGTSYSYGQLIAPHNIIKSCTDEQFDTFVEAVNDVVLQEAEKRAEEERIRKEETERLAKVAAEQEQERKRLVAEAKVLQTERDRIEREKRDAEEKVRREAEAKVRQEEMEAAKTEAAEAARLAEQERIKREAEDKARKEEQSRIRAEKKAARQPDKVKLIGYLSTLFGMPVPELKTEEGLVALEQITKKLQVAEQDCYQFVNTL